MILIGLGKTIGTDLSPKALASVKAPRPQAGLGVTVDPFRKIVYTGERGEWRNRGASIALQIILWVTALDLDWDVFRHPKVIKWIICKLGLMFSPALRVDGNPDNPRLIWVGSYAMYIIETLLTKGIKDDMRNSMNFGYHTTRVHEWISKNRGGKFLSGDISQWDLSQYWKSQVNVWKAWQELYHLPRAVTVLCVIYNICAPILLPTRDGAAVQSRLGIQPSGSGAFVVTNNLLNLCYQRFISIEQGFEVIPLIFGDDFVVPVQVGASEWAVAAVRLFGIRMKVDEQVISKTFILFLRRFFFTYSQWSKGGYYHEPVISSRLRNALYPRSSSPNSRHPAVVALAMRAQSVEIIYAARYSQKMAYNELWQEWESHVCPTDMLLLDYTDQELIAMMPPEGWEVRDSLTYVKRAIGIDDTLKLFKDIF
jgi:hypothetical protein